MTEPNTKRRIGLSRWQFVSTAAAGLAAGGEEKGSHHSHLSRPAAENAEHGAMGGVVAATSGTVSRCRGTKFLP
ncbi:MAG: hypothetical protein HQ581_05780 [Planctomycetes bacterium]|nr:hypothetical protein [Planctomycetota bacterium]